MHCCDTGGEHPAVRLEHVDVQSMSLLNEIIGSIKRVFHGNGKITLILNGGTVANIETQTRTAVKRDKKLG